PLQNRFDVHGWTAIINFMERTDPFAEVRDPNRVSPVIDAYKPELAAYLAKVRGPSSAPLKYQLVPRPSGDAAQVVITEFDLPFDLPPGDTRDSLAANRGNLWSNGEPSDHMPPHDARVDQRGVVWFTDQINPAFTIGSLDPKTSKVSGYKLADEEGNSVGAHGLGVDKAGNIWITNSGEGTFSKFDPKTEKFTRFPRPDSLPRVGGTLNIDSKGMLWAETPVGAIKLDPS